MVFFRQEDYLYITPRHFKEYRGITMILVNIIETIVMLWSSV